MGLSVKTGPNIVISVHSFVKARFQGSRATLKWEKDKRGRNKMEKEARLRIKVYHELKEVYGDNIRISNICMFWAGCMVAY